MFFDVLKQPSETQHYPSAPRRKCTPFRAFSTCPLHLATVWVAQFSRVWGLVQPFWLRSKSENWRAIIFFKTFMKWLLSSSVKSFLVWLCVSFSREIVVEVYSGKLHTHFNTFVLFFQIERKRLQILFHPCFTMFASTVSNQL